MSLSGGSRFIAILGLTVSISRNTVEGAWLGLVMAGIGLLITVANQDIFDLSPVSPLNAVEEVVSTVAVGAAVAAYWWTTPPGTRNTVQGHYLSVDVPDDSTSVNITLQMWSYDSSGHNQHSNIAIAQDCETVGGVLVCYDRYGPVTFQYYLQAPYHSTWYNFSGHDGGSLQALPLTVIVSTIVPYRIGTSLIVPADYSGIYNVTDSQGIHVRVQ